MNREYHITFGNSKRVLKLKDDDDLDKEISETFDIAPKEFLIQKWNNEWDDWEDSSVNDLPSRAKLKIELQASTLSPDDVTTADASVTLDDSTDSRVIGCETSFPIRYFTPSLLKALKTGERLDKSQRGHILSILYDEMCKTSLFPTKDQYKAMAENFVQNFPSLATGIAFADAVSLWRTALSEKFRSERKSLKRKFNVLTEKPIKKIKDSIKVMDNSWGIPISNFLPEAAEGETPSSLETHIRWMQSEYTKLRKDTAAINQRMEVTFPERRRLIVKEAACVKKIKEIYPCLFEENQFLAEFKRLLSLEIEDIVIQNINKYGKAIIKLTSGSELGRNLRVAMSCTSETTVKENLAAKIVPILLTVLAKENCSNILRPSSQATASTYPTIVFTEATILNINECEIYCGEEKICKCMDLQRAIVLLIGTYYILGIQYPKEAITTLKLMQHLLFNIKDTTKKTKKFLKLINIICSNI